MSRPTLADRLAEAQQREREAYASLQHASAARTAAAKAWHAAASELSRLRHRTLPLRETLLHYLTGTEPRRTWGASELATLCQRPVEEVTRALRDLVAEGHAVRDGNRYRAVPRENTVSSAMTTNVETKAEATR